jgi:hypothetical protein
MTSSRVRRRPTLGAVAAQAGVSTATVSNALNGTGRLSEGIQPCELAQIPDDVAHPADHVPGVDVLAEVSVGPQPHGWALRIADLVGCQQPGPERVERFAGLALVPLPALLVR